MHPAPSIILFTVLSGFGFGTLFFLGLGIPLVAGMEAFWLFALGGGSAAVGLLASVFHLGHPERAWKAFRQWRSSWLSREGWLSVTTLLLAAVFGGAIVFLGQRIEIMGQIMSAFAVVTVFATSMIYTQLKTVPRWNDPTTPLVFLGAALAGGAFVMPGMTVAAGLGALALLQVLAWLRGAGRFTRRAHSLGTATGLGGRGDVRAFEPPHTGTNYLLREMVHVVARRNSMPLKIIAILLMAVIPALLLVLGDSTEIRAIALAVHLLGMVVSRWLFFAEAEHVVGLYYGKR